MLLPQVLDASVALVVEGYQSLGADWWEALERAQGAGEQTPPDPEKPPEKTEQQIVAENNATLMNIMGALGQSNFKGTPR